MSSPSLPLTAAARVDRRTKNLIPRLHGGEIAIIDHRDLDGLSAAGLAERQPAAVVNASPSISGRYPNRGPSLLLRAGIPLLDLNDLKVMDYVKDGDTITLNKAGLTAGDRHFAGSWVTAETVDEAIDRARRFLGTEIEAFARNTLEYIERERHLVVDNLEIPELTTSLVGRHTVIVVRGEGYKQDLEAILPYIRERRPALIAVDGGADALLEVDLRPDLIVGDMDSVSDRALSCGAEIVVHSYPSTISVGPNGSSAESSEAVETTTAPGLKRLKDLKIEGKLFSVAGTSEDMAMLIAYEKGAELIVTVGAHFGLVDFLDKGRAGMASTFLVRLRVASRLVDARGVSALYQGRSGLSYLGYLFIAAAAPVIAVAALSPGLKASFSLVGILFRSWLKRHGL